LFFLFSKNVCKKTKFANPISVFANSINDFVSVVFRKICNKFLKWFSIAKRNNSKKPKEKNEFVFCVAILFSSVKLELLTGVFNFFSFFQTNGFFLATNGIF